jgi:anti-sigma B factor antagonist
MDTTTAMIEVERHGDTLILTPRRDLSELDYLEIEAEGGAVLRRLVADPSIRNVVVDFGRTDYFGSSALGLLVRLDREVRRRGGGMALYHVSAHEQDVLRVTGLDTLWAVRPSRGEAIEAAGGCLSAT